MPRYEAKTHDPIRVPDRLWEDLHVAWPTRTDPSGFLGAGAINSLALTPKQYTIPASNNVFTSDQGFTLAFTVILSFTWGINSEGWVWTTCDASAGTFNNGIRVSVNSGKITYYEVTTAGATLTLVASVPTLVGSRHRMAIVRDPSSGATYRSIFFNGTLVNCATGIASWTLANTCYWGHRVSVGSNASNAWSGGIHDVAIFRRSLTVVEVKQLYEALLP